MTTTCTERELILAKREGYVAATGCGCPSCKASARREYPLPPIHREVTLGDGVRVRVKDGSFELNRPWNNRDVWVPWRMSAGDMRALMDLLENPMEADPE